MFFTLLTFSENVLLYLKFLRMSTVTISLKKQLYLKYSVFLSHRE